MSIYFSIGEMSSLHNISIQALRNYDKIGLLKPAYVDEKSSYRYYSIEQFIVVDFIRHYKTIGIPLKEIKKIMEEEMTPDVMRSIIEKQDEIISNKIGELNKIKSHIKFLDERIKSTYSNEIIIKLEEERNFIKYDYITTNSEELEVNIRKVFKDIEVNYGLLNLELVFTTSYDILKDDKKVNYKNIMLYTKEYPKMYIQREFKLPKGKYITMNYDESYSNNLKCYERFMEHIQKNDLKVCGDIYEFSIMPRVDLNGKEKTLTQLQILIKE